MSLSSDSWQLGMHFSFDTEPFLLRGLAGLTLWQGSAYRGISPEEARRRWSRFGRIHTPADEWPGNGDDAAIAQHLELYRIAVETFGEDAAPPAVSFQNPSLATDACRRRADALSGVATMDGEATGGSTDEKASGVVMRLLFPQKGLKVYTN